MFNIELIEDELSIEKAILSAMQKDIKKWIKGSSHIVQEHIKNAIRTAIKNSFIYQELGRSGDLVAQLGLLDGQIRLYNIIEHWAENIVVEIDDFALKISAIKADYEDVLSLPDSVFTTPENQYELPWLQWLLLSGSSTLVQNYYIKYKFAGRTGLAIMVENTGSAWSLDLGGLPFGNTINDNFVTEAIRTLDDTVEIGIINALQEYKVN